MIPQLQRRLQVAEFFISQYKSLIINLVHNQKPKVHNFVVHKVVNFQKSGKEELMLRNIKEFLMRLTPKISFSVDPANEMSVSLGIAPEDYSPEEILQLPEKIAHKMGKHIVVCIDEFQQIGNLPDSLEVQKRIRGVWQLQQEVSYCLYGSKKHMLSKLFQSKSMPFYQFGDIRFLQPIALDDWIPFIRDKFETNGQSISDEQVTRICMENCVTLQPINEQINRDL